MAEIQQVIGGFRDPDRLRALADRLARLSPAGPLTFMHVCGTHENSIARFGLRALLPHWLRIIAGPGCPVCVCPPSDIELAVRLALDHQAILATYGDMLHVPGRTSLAEARAQGGDVRVVQGIFDAVSIAQDTPQRQVVMLAVGFETTACTTAAVVLSDPPKNFSVLLSHRLIPPALGALLQMPQLSIDGFLLPGHVLTVTGFRAYEPIATDSQRPMAVAGFEAVDIMLGLLRLSQLAVDGATTVENAYRRAVRPEGNPKAAAAMDRAFAVSDARWRGLGSIAGSGLMLREPYLSLDALTRFDLQPDPTLPESLPGCECGKVMMGLLEPEQCSLFGKTCTPDDPRGPCMVSFEGTCRNRYQYQEA